LGVLYVLGNRLVEARELFSLAVSILEKSHTESTKPLLAAVRSNLELAKVAGHFQSSLAIDVGGLKRFFHGQHFNSFDNDKREDKMQIRA